MDRKQEGGRRMEKVEIGIIGGTGGIGQWFVPFFHQAGYAVHAVGRKAGMPLAELAARCRVVVVAVPIAATAEVIAAVGPLLPPASLLMDFTSLKADPVRRMLAATAAEVVGCHPLFGPDAPTLAGQNVILCPARGERWLAWLEGLFRRGGANVTRTAPAEHDRMMALVQGLTHLETMLTGLTLRAAGVPPETLAAFSTPVFRAKQAVIEKVFARRPEMYAEILTANPGLPALLSAYERHLDRLGRLVRDGDAAGLAELLKGP
jgi:prephenate dehydrogenase